MKIELKKIQVFERMSEETTAFAADLYINGEKVGYAKNDGRGGMTDYGRNYDKNTEKMNRFGKVIQEAEEYCNGLPPGKFPAEFGGGTYPMSLENFIDDLVFKFEEAKRRKKMEKKMETHILFGTDRSYYHQSLGRFTVAQALAIPNGPAKIKSLIEEMRTKMPDGRVLNTNLPADLIS